MDIFNESLEEIYRSSRHWRVPSKIGSWLKIQPGKVIIYTLGVLVGLMVLGIFEMLICDVLTFVFPARWTLISISSPNFSSDKLWVTYWIIYSVLKVVDELFSFFLQFIPFYYAIKTSFLLVLCAPKIQGALVIYNNVFVQLMKEIKKLGTL